MARGMSGAFGRKLNAPYVWIPLCVLFLRRSSTSGGRCGSSTSTCSCCSPSASRTGSSTAGDRGLRAARVPGAAVPAGPRAVGGLRPRAPPGRSCRTRPHAARGRPRLPHGVPGRPQRRRLERDRRGLRGRDRRRPDRRRQTALRRRLLDDVERGDTYGPVTYLLYVPFEQALPWSGRWDDLRGARRGHRLRPAGARRAAAARPAHAPGREGTALGVALAYAWSAYPYTAFVLESNSNDTLVALACIGALLAATMARDRVRGRARWRSRSARPRSSRRPRLRRCSRAGRRWCSRGCSSW